MLRRRKTFTDKLCYIPRGSTAHRSFVAHAKKVSGALHFTASGLIVRRGIRASFCCMPVDSIAEDFIPYKNIVHVSAETNHIPCFPMASLCSLVVAALALGIPFMLPSIQLVVVLISCAISIICLLLPIRQCRRSGKRARLKLRRATYRLDGFAAVMLEDRDSDNVLKRTAIRVYGYASFLFKLFNTFNPLFWLTKGVLFVLTFVLDGRQMASPFTDDDELEIVVPFHEVGDVMKQFEARNCPLLHSQLIAIGDE